MAILEHVTLFVRLALLIVSLQANFRPCDLNDLWPYSVQKTSNAWQGNSWVIMRVNKAQNAQTALNP